jgi:hypothetical protein
MRQFRFAVNPARQLDRALANGANVDRTSTQGRVIAEDLKYALLQFGLVGMERFGGSALERHLVVVARRVHRGVLVTVNRVVIDLAVFGLVIATTANKKPGPRREAVPAASALSQHHAECQASDSAQRNEQECAIARLSATVET